MLIVFPFLLTILGLAFGPMVLRSYWHKIQTFFFISLAFSGIAITYFCIDDGLAKLEHTLLFEYIPFIMMISCLFVVSHGIHLGLNFQASPLQNTIFLFLGSILASVVGTSGASMILLRPFLQINKSRSYKTHFGVFFIFLVCNVGGCLTPLGDPPLFLGYLRGVPFSFPLLHLWKGFLFVSISILGVFYVIDSYFFKKEAFSHTIQKTSSSRLLSMKGAEMFLFFFIIIASSFIKNRTVYAVLLFFILLSSFYYVSVFKKDHFSLLPLKEIAIVFLTLFITMVPLPKDLGALNLFLKPNGSYSESALFWICGGLSSVLDNAPTYLLFFERVGGIQTLDQPSILTAISLGAVFMGAITYIGNAPNFMVRSICLGHAIPMPSFVKYMGWSCGILLPIFFIMCKILNFS